MLPGFALVADKHVEPEDVIGPCLCGVAAPSNSQTKLQARESSLRFFLGVLASQHHVLSAYHSFKSLYSDVLVNSKHARVFRN
jgi:hypothetical protein